MCGMARDFSLDGDEQPVLLLHPHWKVLIRPVLLAVLVVAAALVVEVLIPPGSAAAAERLVVAAVALLVLMLWLMIKGVNEDRWAGVRSLRSIPIK